MQTYPPSGKLIEMAQVKIDKTFEAIEQEPRNRKERRTQEAKRRKTKSY